MPRVAPTPESIAYPKIRVYEAALAEILADGKVTPRERGTRDALQQRLDLAPEEEAALEAELSAGSAPA